MRSLLLAILPLAAALPVEAKTLAPTGKWNVDYGETQCVAIRPYGTEKDPLHFVIKPSPTSDVVQISWIREGGNSGAIQEETKIRFDDGDTFKLTQLTYGISKRTVSSINLTGALAARLATSSSVDWDSARGDRNLDLGPMAAVMNTLARCRESLRQYYHLDPALQDRLKTKSRTEKPLIGIFTSDDYPAQAAMQRATGLTSIALLIDENGKLADCMVDQTSGVASLDAMSCYIIRQRAKFTPAIGVDGKPAKDGGTVRIRWEMP